MRVLSPVAPVAAALLQNAHGDVRSSVDGALQRFAQEALRRQLAGLRERNVRDGAVVVLDNGSGEVLAYVANTGDSQVDGVAALRQAGSTLKPFLYELALERRVLTAASLLDDAPIDIRTAGGLYVPQNYEKDFKGAVSVRTSLAGSLNVPAVKTLMLVGLDRFYQRLRDVGIDTLREDPDFYGYSLALGSGEVTLFQLANAYRVLANAGLAGTPALTPRGAERKHRVAEEAASYIVADILSDRAARAITFGLDNDLATAYWSAVKTGTSKDMRDNWAVGFSRRFTVGVWVGNFDGEPMWDVSGVTGAAPVWRDVMDFLQRGLAAEAPPAPAGVERGAVTYEPAVEPPRSELFLAGTRQDVIRMVSAAERRPRIAYPADSAVLALDPDIPPGRERVSFSAQAGAGLRWQLDGTDLGDAAVPYPWTPTPGRHVLALVDAHGREIARAAFAVRGSRAAE
jgi:penicillin-binding protein 1C